MERLQSVDRCYFYSPGAINLYLSCKNWINKINIRYSTVKFLCIGTDRSQQTVQTKIRLLLQKQSDQGLGCLPLHQLLLDA